ncbi:pilus assembly protein TadG-related protein [Sphingomonas japonica]|uniref:Membrane protein n=1 Tax=Sphingomonas japonica TaxID=511662 RepID=A0ABX0TXC9_9SPHN|nr:pilus assembly protein TadG-related protein [Sphingomonas japonica]NIJ22964.1 putative membrane protein [Sphingomonas japonica]
MRRLRLGRRGGIGPIFACGLPMLIGSAALAVDLGAAQLESRRLQGIADAAALAAAGNPARAQATAEAVVAESGWTGSVTTEATRGRYRRDAAIPVADRFDATGAVNAVRVRLEGGAPTYFARIFGARHVAVARTGTAMRSDYAAFSIGSRLAAVDGGLLNGLLGALTGSSVSLSVMDYNALIGTDIDLLAFLGALRTTASLGAVSYDDVLAAQVTRSQLLDAMAAVVGDATARNALAGLADAAGGGTVALAPLFDLGPIGDLDRGEAGLVRVNAMAMLSTLLQHGSGVRQVDLDLGATVPGLARTRVRVAIGERPQGSPWISITELGTPILRTAQARIYVEAKLGGIALGGLGTIAGIELPLFVELASAEARLTDISCATRATRSVSIEARTGPGKAAIARIDTGKLDDFSTPMTFAKARLVDTLLVDIDGKSVVDLGSVEPWQQLRFSGTEVDAASVRTISSSHALEGVAVSLLRTIELTPVVGGFLPLPVGPIVNALGAALIPLGPALDSLVNVATGAIGLRYGQADVRVTGMRCGRPVLVA